MSLSNRSQAADRASLTRNRLGRASIEGTAACGRPFDNDHLHEQVDPRRSNVSGSTRVQ